MKRVYIALLFFLVVALGFSTVKSRNFFSYKMRPLLASEPFKILEEDVRFCVISPTYNSKKDTVKSVKSVLSQKYSNWHMHIIDDASPDMTYDYVSKYLDTIDQEDRVNIYRNDVNLGAMRNIYNAVNSKCQDEDVVVLLDGDDYLYTDYVFHKLYKEYKFHDAWNTYSRWISLDQYKYEKASFYSQKVVDNNEFRGAQSGFHHLRTFKSWLFKKIKYEDFLKPNGEFYKLPCDVIMYLPMMEMASKGHIRFIPEPLLVYNNVRSDNDNEVKPLEQLVNHRTYVFKNRYKPLKNKYSSAEHISPIKMVDYDLATHLLIDTDKVNPETFLLKNR